VVIINELDFDKIPTYITYGNIFEDHGDYRFIEGFISLDPKLMAKISFMVKSPKWFYKEYLKSEKWRDFRAAKLKETNFSCEMCKSKKNLHLHHLTYKNLGNESDNDVMVLC